jgi:phage-related protein
VEHIDSPGAGSSSNRQHNDGHPVAMRQQSLFAVRETPRGLLFKADFLTVQEERKLLALLQTLSFYPVGKQLDKQADPRGEFTIEYVELPNGRAPARDFVDSLDAKAAARIDAFIERLRIYGNRMQGKFVKKLTGDIFELQVKQFDRIFRVLFFYQRGMLIVITSGFQKKTEQTPPAEITKAEELRKLWMKFRNRYTGSQKERAAILKELGL